MPNLTRKDLRDYLPWMDLDDAQLDVLIEIVEGWLIDAMRPEDDALPEPLPKWLWAYTTELAAILAENPTSLAQKTSGPTSMSWPLMARRDAIMARIEKRYNSDRKGPRGTFPDALSWPEPEAGTRLYPFGSGYIYVEPGSATWVGLP